MGTQWPEVPAADRPTPTSPAAGDLDPDAALDEIAAILVGPAPTLAKVAGVVRATGRSLPAHVGGRARDAGICGARHPDREHVRCTQRMTEHEATWHSSASIVWAVDAVRTAGSRRPRP